MPACLLPACLPVSLTTPTRLRSAAAGLRAGVRPAPGGPLVLHAFDHVLLDPGHWPLLQPDLVLQLGGHLTSKRTAQFLEWCALQPPPGRPAALSSAPGAASSIGGSGEGAGGTVWVFADRSPARHDQSHLLAHSIQAPIASLLVGVRRLRQQQAQQQKG